MAGPPITLAAALRDCDHPDPRLRDKALRHMGDALLAELGPTAKRWRAADRHPRGAQVIQVLTCAMSTDPSPVLQGFAAISLGQLGDPQALPLLRAALKTEGEGEEPAFRRECAAIGLAELAAAAMENPAAALLPAIAAPLASGLASPHPEVRFQCAGTLVDVLGNDAEEPLASALAAESNTEVRRGLCEALARIDHPSPATIELLLAVLNDTAADLDTRFAAAIGLTAARNPAAAPLLLKGLGKPEFRNRALEALAALGALAPAEAIPKIRAIASSWLRPRVTRVRAAYALARIRPKEGERLLDRFRRSRSAAVQEALADAHTALKSLAARENK